MAHANELRRADPSMPEEDKNRVPEERQQTILELLEARGQVTIAG